MPAGIGGGKLHHSTSVMRSLEHVAGSVVGQLEVVPSPVGQSALVQRAGVAREHDLALDAVDDVQQFPVLLLRHLELAEDARGARTSGR